MKKKAWKTRAWALALSVTLALALLPAAGRAVLSDVYFTAVNEQLLDLTSDTMPFWCCLCPAASSLGQTWA